MRATREEVMAALVAKLSGATFSRAVGGVTTWKTVSRKLRLFSDVPKHERPALFITEHTETSSNRSENTPQIATFTINLFIYTNSAGVDVPAADLNVILEAIDDALAPDYTGKQTLGGLVSHCRIEGDTLKDPGDIDGDGLLWVPIKILGP